jgi:hypothetical protein
MGRLAGVWAGHEEKAGNSKRMAMESGGQIRIGKSSLEICWRRCTGLRGKRSLHRCGRRSSTREEKQIPTGVTDRKATTNATIEADSPMEQQIERQELADG